MVLVSNEWRSNEADQKSLPANQEPLTTTNAIPSSATTTTAAAIASANAESVDNKIESILIEATRSAKNTGANNPIIIEIDDIQQGVHDTTPVSVITPSKIKESKITKTLLQQKQQQRNYTVGSAHRNFIVSSIGMDDTATKKYDDTKCQEALPEKHESETASHNTRDTENNNADNYVTTGNNIEVANCENSYADTNTNTLQPLKQSTDQNVKCAGRTSNLLRVRKTYSTNALPQPQPQQPQQQLTHDNLNNGALNQTQSQQQQQQQQPGVITYGNALDSQQLLATASSTLGGNNATSNFGTLVIPTPAADSETPETVGDARIVLMCDSASHPFQTRSITLTPNIECKVGRLIAKSKASEGNAIFDCKVLSRNHAVLWYTDDGKFWVKDTKSSNGTFINDNKLGTDPAELHYGDIVKFGVEVVENSRKEVHGCIIALVKCYLPDGREAISLDANMHRLTFTGGNRISFEEIQRLNAFIQEIAQREKLLKMKLCSLQKVLDSTRKSSMNCWQSMISEDQLLHKINFLEKKLQLLEKNAPENTLKNEIMKLLDDKTSYQLTAKEALRKVYQERCEAMETLTKVEAAYAASETECDLLRDQITTTKQSLHEVNGRLIQLEAEYNKLKDETRQQQEAKDRDSKEVETLRDHLHSYELECEDLRLQVANLLKKLEEHDVNKLREEEQALAKLDDAIRDLDFELGDADRDGDDDEHSSNKVELKETHNGTAEPPKSAKKLKKKRKTKAEKEELALKQKVVRKSTVMKWLKNSELNNRENTKDIFDAIFNNDEDSDEAPNKESISTSPESDAGVGVTSQHLHQGTHFENVYSKFSAVLENVQMNLQKVEDDNKLETIKTEQIIKSLSDSSSVEHDSDEDFEEKMDKLEMQHHDNDGEVSTKRKESLDKNNENYQLLISSVNMLRDAFNEIYQQQVLKQPSPTIAEDSQENNVIVTEQEYVPATQIKTATIEPINTNETVEEVGLLTEQTMEMLQDECDFWKQKVSLLNDTVNSLRQQKETLEQQITVDNVQDKTAIAESCRIAAGTVTANDISDVTKTEISPEKENKMDKSQLNIINTAEAADDNDETNNFEDELETLNIKQIEQEEELIAYKERLELSESNNLKLRNEISLLKTNAHSSTRMLIRQALPIGALALAALVYFLSSRF